MRRERDARPIWDFPLTDQPHVLIVGAGPAGALAARQLAMQGAGVLLVDKSRFPRSKVCGCCLNGAALSVLDRVGLADLPARSGARPLCVMRLSAGWSTAELCLHREFVLSRARLDQALAVAAMDAGAEFLDEVSATWTGTDNGRPLVQLVHHDRTWTVRSDVLIVADGLGGSCLQRHPQFRTRVAKASRMGAGCVLDAAGGYADGVLHMSVGREGYVGLVRLEDGRLDIAAALEPRAVRSQGSPGPVVARLIENAGWEQPPGLLDSAWRGTVPLSRELHTVAAPRIFVLGDAAGYVEPFTGEGIGWALATATAVAPLALRAAEMWNDVLQGQWIERYQQMLGARKRRCRLLTRLLRHTTIFRWITAAIAIAPWLAGPIVKGLDRPFSLPEGRDYPATSLSTRSLS